MLILLTGCSGVGKNTIVAHLLKKHKNLKFLKNCTTRERRPYEVGDQELYNHLTREEFENKVANGEFFEYEEIHGNLYGTLKCSFEEVAKSKYDYIKDIGVLGKKALETNFSKYTKVVPIFLTAPRDVLVERLKGRGENEIEHRLERMDYEMSFVPSFKYVVENIDFEKTIEQIENIIKENK